MAWPWMVGSWCISYWWVYRPFAFGKLRIGRPLCSQGKCCTVGGFGLLLVEQHFMAEQLILEVIKPDLILSGSKGICGDKAGKWRIQTIKNERNQFFIKDRSTCGSKLVCQALGSLQKIRTSLWALRQSLQLLLKMRDPGLGLEGKAGCQGCPCLFGGMQPIDSGQNTFC